MDRRYVCDAEYDLDGGEDEESGRVPDGPGRVMTADGGGTVGTVLHPVDGGARIARYMVAIAGKTPGLELLERSVNGVPAWWPSMVVTTVASFEVVDGRVTRIRMVRNPSPVRSDRGVSSQITPRCVRRVTAGFRPRPSAFCHAV